MDNDITAFVGLDVHKNSIAIGVAEPGRAAPHFLGTTGPELVELTKALSHLGRPDQLLLAYEAGPCGFALARELAGLGYRCEVIAVSKMPRKPGDRVKTDRRDALNLARYLRSGELTAVWVPDAQDEAIRDLSRAREDAVKARLNARHQLKAILLRHGLQYTGGSGWSQAHERYLAKITFKHPAQDIAYVEYRNAIKEAEGRVERVTAALREQVASWRWGPVVNALMGLRGIDFVSAVTLVAELGNLARFPHPKELMSYLGLVPSEYSSGESRSQGHITKTGNGHARRVLIEAAWCYRFRAHVSAELTARSQTLPKAVQEISWRAQLRLCGRFRRFAARGINQNKTCVAVARELTGFIWDIARQVPCVS
jgi:transposase